MNLDIGTQNDGSPKMSHVLIPRTCKYVMIHGKGELRLHRELKLLIR